MAEYERKYKLELRAYGPDGFPIFSRTTLPAATYTTAFSRTILLDDATSIALLVTGQEADVVMIETTGRITYTADYGTYTLYPGMHIYDKNTATLTITGSATDEIEVRVTALEKV